MKTLHCLAKVLQKKNKNNQSFKIIYTLFFPKEIILKIENLLVFLLDSLLLNKFNINLIKNKKN